jgi:peptidyl-prolyl cis-trans isomerase D
MEFLRNAAKTWVAKLLMALLVMSFGIWGIRDVSSSFLSDILSFTGWGPKDLVHVGGRTIMAPEYTQALNQQIRRIQQQSGQKFTVDDAHKMGLDKQILDGLIANASVDAQRDKLQLAVSDKSIGASIATNKAFLDSSGKFDAALFRRVLQQNELTEAGFVAGERQNRLRAMVTGLAEAPIKLPRVLTTALAQYRGEMRDAKYFSISASEADVAPPTDADLRKQYEATPAAYTAPEYRSIAIIKIEPSDIADKLSISDDDLKSGYEKFKSDYFTPEKRDIVQVSFPTLEDAKKAKARIAAGEDLIKIAIEKGAKVSDITLNDRQRGDFLDEKIANAAFSLAKDTVSDPIEGSLTIALLKITNIVSEKQSSLDETKPVLLKRMQLEKAKDEIQSIFDAVENGRGEQKTFEDIARSAGIPFVLVPAVSAAGVDKVGKEVVMPSKPELLKAAYASDVGQIDDALSLNDSYFWYEVREVIPSAIRPLDTIKDSVKKDYVAAKLRDAASEKAKKIVARATAGETLDALAKEAGGEIKIAAGLKRNETSDTFDNTAVVSFFDAPDQGFAWSLEGDGKTARVMQVVKVTVPAVMAVSPEAKTLQDEAAAGLSRDISESYVKALRANANVSINEVLWQQNTGANFAADQQ